MSNSASKLAIQLQKLSNEATEKSFKYNREEANSARTWQTEMSNTAHQREVKDLIAAGLNPALSAGGQGAQSYTTSSASAQAENPAGAIASVYGSEMSANATRSAAAVAAKAARSAAAISAAAQKYAADRSYAANKYSWDSKISIEKWKAKNAPQQSVVGFIDKHIGNTGLPNAITKKIRSYFSGTNTTSLFSSYSSKSWSLNSKGVSKVNNALNAMGVTPSASTRKLFVNGFINGNKSSISKLINLRAIHESHKVNLPYSYVKKYGREKH